MARSVGAAAAAGLESGLGMGLRLRQQQQNEEDTTRRREREDTLYAQQQDDRSRRLALDDEERQLKAITDQLEGLRAEGEGYATQYGGKVPDEIATPYSARVREVTGARDSLLRKRYEPIVKRREQELADLSSRLQAGQIDVAAVPDDDLYRAVVTATKRDPRDLMSVDGQPSRVHQAVTDTMTGLQTKNEGMLLTGVNALLEPELKVGVGEASPHGGKIVGKRIVKLIPDPRDPAKFMPVVKVYVSKGGKATGGDVQRMEKIRAEDPDAPDGASGYYLAPITKNRSSDPEDEVASVDVAKAMDYAAQMQTFSTLLDHPEVRAKIERAQAQRGDTADDFLAAFYAVKGKMPAKQVTADKIDLGDRVRIEERDPTGRVTGVRELAKGATPKAPGSATGLAGQIQAVQEYAEENGISEAEAAIRLQRQGLLRAPKGAGGGSGGGLAGPSGGKSEGLTGEEFLATLSADDARIVRGLAEGTIKPESISTKGDRREKMLAKVAQYQPEGSGAGGKPLPEPVRKVVTEARDNAATMERMLTEFKPEYAGKGVLGIGADLQLDASSRLGVDNPSVQWWKNYRKQAQLVERHSMFGASLTQGEQAAWNSADISPGQDPKVIEENLRTRAALTKKVLDYTREDMISAGHSDKRINEIANRGAAPPADTDQRKSGQVTGNKPAAAAAAAPAQPPRTATNPATGERLMLKDGKWVPMR